MSPDLALLSNLIGSNYPCFELIFTVPKDVRAIEVRLYIKGHLQGYSSRLEYLINILDIFIETAQK